MAQEVLRIEHEHFNLYVSSVNAAFLFSKAKIRNNEISNQSEYSVSSGKIEILNFEHQPNFEIISAPTWPVFFENNTYIFEVEFKKDFIPSNKPYLKHELKEISEQFNYREPRFYGTINFGNDIGKFKFNLKYSLNHIAYDFLFEFEVFPIKLDYKKDYPKLIESIQKAYPLLVLDFLKKTFSGSGIGDIKHHFIWWHIFQTIYKNLIQEAQFIINKPHNRLLNKTYYVKKEKLIHLSPVVEEEYYQNRKNENHYYQITQKELSIDTPENRFIKYALNKIHSEFRLIHSFISVKYSNQITSEFQDEYNIQLKKLSTLKNHPLWQGVGEFTGFKQESLAIQRKPGYSGFYKFYLLLMQGLKLMKEDKKIEFKNIAELYQIWCFITLKDIIQDITSTKPEADFDDKFAEKHWSDLRLTEVFSCFKFNLQSGDRLELLHDYSYKTRESKRNHLMSYTEEQRPDITLKLYKKDLPEEAIHTFLFDAKYRIKTFQNDEYVSDDAPPPDTLNQMHRYRDSLFFKTKNYYNQAEKGVIGGYILFPGELTNEKTKEQYYYKSISEVNIGAFPLNLNIDIRNNLVREFLIEKVIQPNSISILKESPSQKYIIPEFPDGNVLIGATKDDEQEQYLNNSPKLYHTPLRSNADLERFSKIKYFSHWKKSGECTHLHKVKNISIRKRSEIAALGYPIHKDIDDLYLLIELHDEIILLNNKIKSTRGHRYIRYSSIESFLKAKSFDDFEYR